jgi:putative tricarboxylic transport membrane protein
MTVTGLHWRNAELWGGVIWLALGLFVIDQAYKLEIGTVNAPGMGFAMLWIGLLICALSFGIAVKALASGGPSLASLWQGTRWMRTLVVIAALVIYSFAFSRLGFLVSTIPLMLVLLRAVDPVRWSIAVPLGVGMPILIWWLLKRLLAIQLPNGMFEIG